MFDKLILHLQRREERSALAQAISLWQACREPVVGMLADRLGRRISTRRKIVRSGSIKSRFYEWKTLFQKKDPGDLSALLDTLVDTPAVTTLRLGYLEHWEPDPRISYFLAECLATPPQAWITVGLWDRLFRLVVRCGDGKALRQLKRLEFTIEDRELRELLAGRTAWAVETLEAMALDLPSLEAPEREQLLGFLDQLPLPYEGDSLSEASLLAEIYRNQDDVVLKQVYADFLMEQGDARGELIALQLVPQGEATEKRIQELLAMYERVWLGELLEALVPGQTTWEAGFPVRGVLREIPTKDLVRLATSPLWASFRAISGSGVMDLVEAGHFEQLREVSGEILVVVTMLLAKARLWEKITCYGDRRLLVGREGLIDALMKGMAPKLRHLVIRGAQGSASDYRRLLWHPAGQQLTHLEVSTFHLADWLKGWNDLPFLQHLQLNLNDGTLILHHQPGELDTCRATLPLPLMRHQLPQGIDTWLYQLPPHSLTELSFTFPHQADQELAWWAHLGWFRELASQLRSQHRGLQNIFFLGTEL